MADAGAAAAGGAGAAAAESSDHAAGTKRAQEAGAAKSSGSGAAAPSAIAAGSSASAATPAVVTKRVDRICWEEYFMALAFLSAQRSKDPATQVGACIVDRSNKIVSIGYNGMPRLAPGIDADEVLPWAREAESALDTKRLYVCHAEMNSIINRNAASLEGCRMFVSLFPCNECSKLIIQSGIKEVVYCSDKYKEKDSMKASRKLLELAGVTMRQFVPERKEVVISFSE